MVRVLAHSCGLAVIRHSSLLVLASLEHGVCRQSFGFFGFFRFCFVFVLFIFFFQAEDGIRDVAVTGVQTCALPI